MKDWIAHGGFKAQGALKQHSAQRVLLPPGPTLKLIVIEGRASCQETRLLARPSYQPCCGRSGQ